MPGWCGCAGALPDVSRGPVMNSSEKRWVLFRCQALEQASRAWILVGARPMWEEPRTAVFLARELAMDGEVVLFSPACPSG